MYDYANIDFLTFDYTPSFNKIGTPYLYAHEDAYVYEVTADGAKEIKGLSGTRTTRLGTSRPELWVATLSLM